MLKSEETMRLLNRSPDPIILAGREWEQGADFFAAAAIPDQPAGELRLYYLARFATDPRKNVLCLARSADGLTWSKPAGADGTNIVMRGSGHKSEWGEFMPTTILRDERERDPAQRWKMVYWDRPDPATSPGICLAASADGLAWKPLFPRPIITNANDAMAMIDAIPGVPTPFGSGPFFIYQQTWKYNPLLPTQRDNLKGMHRRISIWTCNVFGGRWVGPITILEPDEKDEPDTQFYWLVPFKAETGGYGGLLNCHHTGDQTMDIQLVSSRDGWTWTRENGRNPLLGLGERGRFDCGSVHAAAQPVKWRGKVLLFYNGHATVHDGRPHYPGDPLPQPAGGIGCAEFDALI
jgi:hypothetical protein